ncbi:MAG: polyprenol monophosphomannose synthase [Oligoflexia bacterium]|nr:polyprenol monophosphomannose synthase [Oligoflexia bacterium]
MKIVIGVATYNEALNIERLITEIHQNIPNQRILVLDDNSPDGTATIVDRLMSSDPHLRILRRPGKLGLGSATLTMMKYAVENNFDAIIIMDADFSHDPKELPIIAKLLEENDFVTGSRYIEGGKCQYGLYRTIISKVANWGARNMAGIPLYECTTAYRGFRTELLRKLPMEKIRSSGYSFQVEVLYYIVRQTNKLKEFPIVFADRILGQSKINKKEMMMSAITLLRLLKKRILSEDNKITKIIK